MEAGRYRCAFDIGGTFTDFALLDLETGAVTLHKSLTTSADPAIGALEGIHTLLQKASVGYGQLDAILHGTTLVTNLIIERKGASTALLTTKGFRDIIEIGTEQRYDIHDIFLEYPDPMVPRRLRLEVDERMSRDGTPLVPIDLDEVRGLLRQARERVRSPWRLCSCTPIATPRTRLPSRTCARRSFPSFMFRSHRRSVARSANTSGP